MRCLQISRPLCDSQHIIMRTSRWCEIQWLEPAPASIKPHNPEESRSTSQKPQESRRPKEIQPKYMCWIYSIWRRRGSTVPGISQVEFGQIVFGTARLKGGNIKTTNWHPEPGSVDPKIRCILHLDRLGVHSRPTLAR